MTKTLCQKMKMWRVKNFTLSWQCKVLVCSKISSPSDSSISRRTCLICCNLRPAQRSTILILICAEKQTWSEKIIRQVKRSRNRPRKLNHQSAATTFTPTFFSSSSRKSPESRVQSTIPWLVCANNTCLNKSERQTSASLILSSWSFKRTWKSLRHKFAI